MAGARGHRRSLVQPATKSMLRRGNQAESYHSGATREAQPNPVAEAHAARPNEMAVITHSPHSPTPRQRSNLSQALRSTKSRHDVLAGPHSQGVQQGSPARQVRGGTGGVGGADGGSGGKRLSTTSARQILMRRLRKGSLLIDLDVVNGSADVLAGDDDDDGKRDGAGGGAEDSPQDAAGQAEAERRRWRRAGRHLATPTSTLQAVDAAQAERFVKSTSVVVPHRVTMSMADLHDLELGLEAAASPHARAAEGAANSKDPRHATRSPASRYSVEGGRHGTGRSQGAGVGEHGRDQGAMGLPPRIGVVSRTAHTLSRLNPYNFLRSMSSLRSGPGSGSRRHRSKLRSAIRMGDIALSALRAIGNAMRTDVHWGSRHLAAAAPEGGGRSLNRSRWPGSTQAAGSGAAGVGAFDTASPGGSGRSRAANMPLFGGANDDSDGGASSSSGSDAEDPELAQGRGEFGSDYDGRSGGATGTPMHAASRNSKRGRRRRGGRGSGPRTSASHVGQLEAKLDAQREVTHCSKSF